MPDEISFDLDLSLNPEFKAYFDVDVSALVNMDIDIAAQMNNFFNVALVFNNALPVVGFFLSLFSASAERRQREQQTRLLAAMNEQLEEINETLDEVLDKLDDLEDAVFAAPIFEKCEEYWALIDTVESAFRNREGFRISQDSYLEFLQGVRYICKNELRLSSLAKLPRTAELVNQLSGGKDEGTVRELLDYAIAAIETRQKGLVVTIVQSTNEFAESVNRFNGTMKQKEREREERHRYYRVRAKLVEGTNDPRTNAVVVLVKRNRAVPFRYPEPGGVAAADGLGGWSENQKRSYRIEKKKPFKLLQSKGQDAFDKARVDFVRGVDWSLTNFHSLTAMSGVLKVVQSFDYGSRVDSDGYID